MYKTFYDVVVVIIRTSITPCIPYRVAHIKSLSGFLKTKSVMLITQPG